MIDLQKHLVAALKGHLKTGKPVRLPAGGDLLWIWFCDLSAGRSWHMNGPNPISWTDIAAYCALARVPMQPHHIAVLRAMDAAFIEHLAKSSPSAAGAAPQVAKRPITAGAFDSMFG